MNLYLRKLVVVVSAMSAVLGLLVAIKLGSSVELGNAMAWAWCSMYHNSPSADWVYE